MRKAHTSGQPFPATSPAPWRLCPGSGQSPPGAPASCGQHCPRSLCLPDLALGETGTRTGHKPPRGCCWNYRGDRGHGTGKALEGLAVGLTQVKVSRFAPGAPLEHTTVGNGFLDE